MKTISFLGLSVMAVLSLAGCSNDELVEKTVAGNYTLNASVEDFKNDSRAALTDDYKFQWTSGDEIGLLGKDMGNVNLSQNASGSSKYGQFSGNVPTNGVPVVAYFPYEENVSVDLETVGGYNTKGKFSITLPGQATDDMKAPMCGDVIDNKVSFQHLCALLKVTIHDIPTEAAKLVLTSSNQALTGKANIKYADGSYVLEMDADANSTTGKVVTYSLASSFSGTKTFLFSIPPASEAYDKLTVSLQKADGSVMVEKELTNTIFTAGSIYVTPPFSAKAAEQVASLADVSNKLSETPNVTVTGTINTSSADATITIPQSDQPLNLTFQNAPVADANNPIKIEGTSASIVTLAVPAASTSGTQKAADYTINTKAEITCAAAPSTSNVGRVATDGVNYYNYGKITVADVKEITIARDVKVEILVIEASTTVRIYGYVKEVVPTKTADEINIVYEKKANVGNVKDLLTKWNKGETLTASRAALSSKRGMISEWDGTVGEPEISSGTYEIFDASELAWFQNKTSLSTTASNITATIDKNAILYVDIDLKNRPWKGMVLGQNCMFDGGDCTISNLAIKEFILNEQSIYTPNACLGLFGAAMQGSSIKNVTLDKITMTAAAKWAGALVGLSYGAVSYEKCTAKNVTITANDFYSYRVGGLVGFIAAINDKDVTISNCHTENVNINAGFALGGLIGTIQGTQTIKISSSSVKNATMTMSNSFQNWLNNSSDWNSANGTPADYIGYMAGFIGDPGMHCLTMTDCSVSSATLLNGHFDLYKNGAGKAFIGGSDFLGRVDNPENVTISLNGNAPTAGVDYNRFEN